MISLPFNFLSYFAYTFFVAFRDERIFTKLEKKIHKIKFL